RRRGGWAKRRFVVGLKATPKGKSGLSTGGRLSSVRLGGGICAPPQGDGVEGSAMSDGGAGAAGSVVSLEPKAKVRPEANDPLERAGRLILDMVGKAASAAEVNNQK